MLAIVQQLDGPAGRAGAAAYPEVLAGLAAADDLRPAGRGIPRRGHRVHRTARPAALHRQDAEQLPARRPDPADPAERQDHRRAPPSAGCCFSAFKQHFARGQTFSYDLADIGRYYRDYVALMAHFDAVLPGKVHRVIYEDMVDDTEGEVRASAGPLRPAVRAGLPALLDNERAVRTASSEQVRRPIFREGLEHWRNYEPWLGPLKDALGPTHWKIGGTEFALTTPFKRRRLVRRARRVRGRVP